MAVVVDHAAATAGAGAPASAASRAGERVGPVTGFAVVLAVLAVVTGRASMIVPIVSAAAWLGRGLWAVAILALVSTMVTVAEWAPSHHTCRQPR